MLQATSLAVTAAVMVSPMLVAVVVMVVLHKWGVPESVEQDLPLVLVLLALPVS